MTSASQAFDLNMTLVKENRSCSHNHRHLCLAMSLAFESLGPESWQKVLSTSQASWLLGGSKLNTTDISAAALGSRNIEAVSWWINHDSWEDFGSHPGEGPAIAQKELSAILL